VIVSSGVHRAKGIGGRVLLVLKPDKHPRMGYARIIRGDAGGVAQEKLQGVDFNWISNA
jgi:hypothetical protein